MECLKGFQYWCVIAISSMALLVISVINPVYGQTSTSGCTNTMITNFTPCINYITGSNSTSANTSSSPTADCCRSLGLLMNSSMDCTCLVLAGNAPFRLPINRTLAVSLPRACNMSGVPVQCKAAGAPLPTPASTVPISASPALAPQPEIPIGITPATSPVSSDTPTTSPGIRPSQMPSAANPSQCFSPVLLLFVMGVLALKYH